MNPNLQDLSQSFLDTLLPQLKPRLLGEKYLSYAADSPNHSLEVLRLVSEPFIDTQIRHSASVNFKNHIKTRWGPSTVAPIPDNIKEQIRRLILPLMLSASLEIQAQLSEALAIIGNHDFLNLWPALLHELKTNFQNAINVNDFVTVNRILAMVNSLFKKFRYEYKNHTLFVDFKYCLDNFPPMLLTTVKIFSMKISGAVGNALVVKPLVEAQRLCYLIFYSLNFLDLPEFFEDTADEWMDQFKNYLIVRYPVVENSGAVLKI